MLHRILEAEGHAGYKLSLRFENGERALLDLGDFVATGGVTEPLRADPELFINGLTIGGGGRWISWLEEIDIDADALWYQAHPDELAVDHGTEAA